MKCARQQFREASVDDEHCTTTHPEHAEATMQLILTLTKETMRMTMTTLT